MKYIKLFKAKGFRNGYVYPVKEEGTHFTVRIGDKIKPLTLEFLQKNEYKFLEY